VNFNYFHVLTPTEIASVPASSSVAAEVVRRLLGSVAVTLMAAAMMTSSFGASARIDPCNCAHTLRARERWSDSEESGPRIAADTRADQSAGRAVFLGVCGWLFQASTTRSLITRSSR
jgi:hypothetical protein